VGRIKVAEIEKENIVRAFEHVQQIPAAQEDLSSNVL
jgi:hypothetical protein